MENERSFYCQSHFFRSILSLLSLVEDLRMNKGGGYNRRSPPKSHGGIGGCFSVNHGCCYLSTGGGGFNLQGSSGLDLEPKGSKAYNGATLLLKGTDSCMEIIGELKVVVPPSSMDGECMVASLNSCDENMLEGHTLLQINDAGGCNELINGDLNDTVNEVCMHECSLSSLGNESWFLGNMKCMGDGTPTETFAASTPLAGNATRTQGICVNAIVNPN